MSLQKFNELLDKPSNNILVDIHSCPIEREDVGDYRPAYDEYFTEVPRGIYVVLISDFGQNKVGERNVQDQDRKMYANKAWPWIGDREIIRTSQLYFPGEKIFNPLMMFGEPGQYDENYDIFNVKTGKAASFNKSNKYLQGRESYTTYSRRVILAKLRSMDGKQKIVYIATCDPTGDKPRTWKSTQWNSLIRERQILQKKHRDKFKNFVKTYGSERRSARIQGLSPAGRAGMGLQPRRWNDDGVDQIHFEEDTNSTTPLRITDVSISDETKACVTPCEYKKSCTNNIPLVGAIAKFCQNKYCKFEDGKIDRCKGISHFHVYGGKRKTKKKRRKTRKRRRRKKKRSRKKRKKKKRTKEKGRK